MPKLTDCRATISRAYCAEKGDVIDVSASIGSRRGAFVRLALPEFSRALIGENVMALCLDLSQHEIAKVDHSKTISRLERGLQLLPAHMRSGLMAYVREGIAPGSFLRAMLEGRLDDAHNLADGANLNKWATWECVLSDYTPIECHNTPGKVAAWIAHNGLSGLGGA